MSRVFLSIPVLALAGMGCGDSTEIPRVSQEWVTECPGDSFCFSRPPDLREVPAQVIDSLAGVFESSELTIRFDHGWYSVSLEHLRDPVVADVTIDGRPGQTLAAGNEIALRVPQVDGRLKLTMQLVFEGPVSSETAQRVFQSIRFLPSRR